MKLTQHDIGGEIISILTKGMYADPKDALREYVQNSVDANAKNIEIKIRQDNITIKDNGNGMDKVAMRKALRLGVSDKNPKKAVGFMGIGLYSSFHLCDKLSIRSKITGQKPNKLEFKFKEMREILESQKDARIEDDNVQQIALLSLMEDHTEIVELEEVDFPNTGTRIELSGLDEDFYESLSKFEEVADYLEKAIPLYFSPDFSKGVEIQEYITKKCKEHDSEFKLVNLFLQINSEQRELYRPYKDSDFNPYPLSPIYKELISTTDGFLGVAWGCLNKANEVIKNEKVRGFLIKKQGFTIGTRNNLLSTFGAKYFNRYVGEFIIVHPKLLPNGARSDFEYSSLRAIFKKIVEDTADAYNTDANLHQEIEKAELDLDKLIKYYRETKAQFNTISGNTSLVLDTYGDLSKLHKDFKKKFDSIWRIKDDRRKDAEEILSLTDTLKTELSDLIEQKRVKTKKTNKNKTQIALELDQAPKPHEYKEPQPQNFSEVIDLIGIPFSSELRQVFQLLDEQFIKPKSKNDADYGEILKKLKGDIEDLFSEESIDE
ncbi:MAG: ATP-binding region ATPase domain protein [Bacteroidetes bacterium]|nr:ATP-binding region ATPase domain protein [Bacteroidota bacterium]